METTDDSLSNVPITAQGHMRLVATLNNLRAAIKAQICRYTIENALAVLEEYAKIYLCEEEWYMKHYRYCGYRPHKEKHDQLVSEIEFLKDELLNIKTSGLKGSYELSVETVKVISDWITGHVLIYDRKLGEFMRGRATGSDYLVSSGCSPEDNVDEKVVPICSFCKRIKGNKGIWRGREHFPGLPLESTYSHSICPECLQAYYADLFQEKR